MLEKITESIVAALGEAGLNAGRSYPRAGVPQSGVFVKAAIRSVRQSESGFARFLGLRERESDGALTEEYGMRCDLEIALDIYAAMDSENAAADCEAAVDGVLEAMAGYAGLKISSVACQQATPDRETGLFLCRCTAECGAMLTFDSDEETGEFTDFILKGELRR